MVTAHAPRRWLLATAALVAGLQLGARGQPASMSSAAAPAPSGASTDAMAGQSSPGAISSSSTGMPGYSSALAPAPGYDGSYANAPSEGATDSPDTALISELQVDGRDLWPFTEAKQKILVDSIQYWVLYGTGFVRVLDVREGPRVNVTKQMSAAPGPSSDSSQPITSQPISSQPITSQPITSQPTGRRLLQEGSQDGMYISPIVTVQVDCGSSLAASSAGSQMSDYAGAPPNGLIAAEAQQRGLMVTNITVLATRFAVPYMPSETTHGEYAGMVIGIVLVAGGFFLFLALLEREKNKLLKEANRPNPAHYQKAADAPLEGEALPAKVKTVDEYEGPTDKSSGHVTLLGAHSGVTTTPRTPRTPLHEQGVLRLWNSGNQEHRLGAQRSVASA